MERTERTTRQRDAIRAVIAAAHRPLSLQEMLEEAQKVVPSLGVATIYRNVKLLLDEGVVQPVTLPGQLPRYELTNQAHHHHFQCTQCQRVYSIDQCPGSLDHLAPQGFTVQYHDLTLYGQCKECKNL